MGGVHVGDRHIYHYNSNFTGDLTIEDKETGKEFRVSAEDVRNLVLEYMAQKKIAELERMGGEELFWRLIDQT